jgi:hypothetical protein
MDTTATYACWTMRLCATGTTVGQVTANVVSAQRTAQNFANSYGDVVILRRTDDGATLLVKPTWRRKLHRSRLVKALPAATEGGK